MADNIKIAYNWIGPKGPIPNTEVPNVLNLASVTEKVSTHTNKYWADSVWTQLFCNNEGFELSAATQLVQKDTFIYPFNLGWRINFLSYFYATAGIFEYGMVPNHILHNVRTGNGYILIDVSAEAWVHPQHLQCMHSYFDYHALPLDKIIYLTGCMNGMELYNQWLTAMNLQGNKKINIISYPISQNSIASAYFTNKTTPKVPEYDTEKVPEKLFLSWNRRYREHRIAITLGLEYFSLLDRSYVSLGKTHPENQAMSVVDCHNTNLTCDYFNIGDPCIDRLINKLPLVLDGETDITQMCQDFDDATRKYYQNSLVSIVTETNYDANEVTITEKSFKPSKEKHPFIIVGAPGSVQALQDMGFKTFNEFWDEGYDQIQSPRQRMVAIYKILQQIGSWNNEQIIDFRRKVKPILDHNYENLKIKSSTKVVEQIKQYILNKAV